ncbi:MAG: EAL domain-containing protein [Rubrivivax sp.]|nr:EAL domain-containing protein [Rubrivivax sp.]
MTDSVSILVVDDESVTRMMVRRVLTDSGYAVLEAEDGQAAVEQCAASMPDLVLMDVRMPRLNGFDACREIRRLASGAHVPVFMLTALDDVVAVTLAFEAGATDFITKPINWALLSQRVRYGLRTARVEQQLRDSQTTLSRAQRIARLAPWSLDLRQGRCRLSPEMSRMLGLDGASPEVGLDELLTVLADEDRQPLCDFIDRLRAGESGNEIEVRVPGPASARRHLLLCGDVSHDETGAARAIFGIAQDVTERRDTEARLSYQAHFDVPTGLPNRVLFRDRVQTAIQAAQRGASRFAVVEVETDALRKSHAASSPALADHVLRALAQRLGSVLREGDTLCRLDGERFALLLGGVSGELEAGRVGRRLAEAFSVPLRVDDWEVLSQMHAGVALFPGDGRDVDTLMARAGAAVLRAREVPGAAFRFYTQDMQDRVAQVIDTQVALYRGLERGEFELHYQPLVDLSNDRVAGVEALLRWHRPNNGLQMPGAFLGILEDSGLIMDTGDWVLRSACRAMLDLPLTLSINVSPRQFRHPNLADRLTRVLEEVRFPPNRLEVEITEQAVMADEDRALATLRAMAEAGMRIALDDYGTGFSSLQRLKTLPVHALKIDRFFVTALLTDRADATIVRSTIELCHQLGIQVVAEGVEDLVTLQRLREYGCDRAQGYGISPPLAAAELSSWLQASRYAAPG